MGAVPYYCEQLFIFTFISLIFLFYTVLCEKNTRKRVFLPFFAYFIGFYTPLYMFLAELYPYDRFGFTKGQSLIIVVCSCVIIPLIHATIISSVMLLSKLFRGNTWDILGYGAIWCISEWTLTLGTLAFPWGNIAISLAGFLPYLQTASLFGKYFISFITVCGCCAIAYGCINSKKLFAFIGAGAILLNTVFGTVLWFFPYQNQKPVSVAIIQGNAQSNEKWQSSNMGEIFRRTYMLTEEAAESGAEIIVLAESAIPYTFKENGAIHSSFASIAAQHDTTIIMGAHYSENRKEYNSAIAILPDGSLSERYDKRHLVPFGEFMPYVDVIGKVMPFVAAFNETSTVFVEGSEPVLITTQHGKTAPLVCFDSIFPEFAREGCQNGAELLTIITNDSWFYDSVGIYTHLRHSQLRSIENGKYTARGANTGISAIINNKGEIICETEPLVEDILYGKVYMSNRKPLYTYIGDVPLYISFIIVVIFIINKTRRTKNGKNSATSN